MMSVRLYQSIPNAKPSFDTCSSSAQVVTVSHCVDRKGANTKASHTQFVAVSKLMNGAFGLIARSFAMLHQGSRFASLGSDTVLPTVCLAVTNMSSLFGSQLVLGLSFGPACVASNAPYFRFTPLAQVRPAHLSLGVSGSPQLKCCGTRC